jgi:hypothetical protein
MHSDHNFLAIFVAAVAAFLLGALWYSPLLFANAWVKAHRHTPEKVAAMQKAAPKAYGISFVCFCVMAFVLHLILGHMGVAGVVPGIMWGFHIWLGFAFTIGLTAHVYGDKPISAFLIDTGYQLVYLMTMGAILAGWH